MSDNVTDTEYREFVQTVIDNVKKNGFPDKKVSFPLEQMYEIAEKKGINFNKVLATLDEILIAHRKTPEKIIFYAKDREPQPQPQPQADANPTDVFSNMTANINPEMFKGKNMSDMMAAASQMMQNLNPEQLEAVKSMYENMSDEERAAMIEQVKKMGMF